MDIIGTASTLIDSIKSVRDTYLEIRNGKADAEQKHRDVLTLLDDTMDKLFTLRSQTFTLNDQVRELQEEIATLRDWRSEQANYRLVKLPAGSSVYLHKSGLDTHQTKTYICPCCYEKEKKSVLQPHDNTPVPAFSTLICPACKTVYKNERIEDAPVIYPLSKRERGCW